MKKIITYLSILLLVVACKKSTPTPNNPTPTNIEGERVSMVTIQETQNSSLSKEDTINYSYDSNDQISRIDYIYHDFQGETQKNVFKFNWLGNCLQQLSNDDTTVFTFDDKRRCILGDGLTYEYSNDYLVKAGYKKGVNIEGHIFSKDTFNVFQWENGNLISDSYFQYEYYNDLLNNSFFTIYPIPELIIPNDLSEPIRFRVDPFNLEVGGGIFFQNYLNFGISTKNLVKRFSNKADDISYDITYKFDAHSRVIEMQMKGKDDIIVYKYTWSK